MKSLNDFGSKEEYEEYLRVYFAGKAMEGFLAATEGAYFGDSIVAQSVKLADKLIRELNK